MLSITGASPSDSFVSYLGHLLGESYHSTEMQSVYSTAQADLASKSNDCFKKLYKSLPKLSVHQVAEDIHCF